MNKLKLSSPKTLSPLAEARCIFEQMCQHEVTDVWLQLLIQEPHQTARELTHEEAHRVRYLATCVHACQSPDGAISSEAVITRIELEFTSLNERLEQARTSLLASPFGPAKSPAEMAHLEEAKDILGDTERSKLNELCRALPEGTLEDGFLQLYEAHLPLPDEALEKVWATFDEDLAKLVKEDSESSGWVSSSSRLISVSVSHVVSPPVGADSFVDGMARLYVRLRKEGLEKPASLPPARRWWAMYSAIFLKTHRPDVLNPDDLRLLRGLASFTLAQLRGDLKGVALHDATEAERRFTQRFRSYDLATKCLLIVDDLAFMLSQLLQLLRVCPCPLVGDDLAYWHAGRTNSLMLERITINLVNAVHCMAADMEKSDPKLRQVREELARFCLGRIGQKKGQRCGDGAASLDSMIESDPYWRACYIYAVDALRVNPDNKGHRSVYWAMQHDPAEEVREVAEELYPRIERKREIADDSSPRRPLITALWWIFQAHRLGLNLEVDKTAIHATLASMLRRTTEPISPIPSVREPETNNTQTNR